MLDSPIKAHHTPGSAEADAAPSILRGNKLVVAGDSKQLLQQPSLPLPMTKNTPRMRTPCSRDVVHPERGRGCRGTRPLCPKQPSQPIILSDELATKFQETLVQNIGQARKTKSFQKSMEKVAAVREGGHEVRSHFGFHLVLHLVFGITSGTLRPKPSTYVQMQNREIGTITLMVRLRACPSPRRPRRRCGVRRVWSRPDGALRDCATRATACSQSRR